MISYLVNAALVVALVFTTWRISRMRRDLRVLRDHHLDFQASVQDATGALTKVGAIINDIYGDSGRVLADLGTRVEEAKLVLRLLDERLDTTAAPAERRDTAA